jgi:WD40 repeat protein
VATRQLVDTHTDPGSQGIYSVAFSPDGSMLAAADTNGCIYLWDAR